MAAVVVILVITGVVAGLVALIGGGFFALIVVPLGIAAAVWLALAGGSKTRTRDVAEREAPQGELFGPGGPDDPGR